MSLYLLKLNANVQYFEVKWGGGICASLPSSLHSPRLLFCFIYKGAIIQTLKYVLQVYLFFFVFRYFSSGWCKQVAYHPVNDQCSVCFLSNRVTPSMTLSKAPHQVWTVIQKDTEGQAGGKIYSAYCTCTAG